MTSLDRLLQRWRIAKAARVIPPGARLLDVGSADGAMFRQLGDRISEGLGIDPDARPCRPTPNSQLVSGRFPEDLPDCPPFDVITMLAVVEHIPRDEQAVVARACAKRLRPGGQLVITTPSPLVDRILDVLERIRLIHGMELEQHYGFHPSETPAAFSVDGLTLAAQRTFQLGLNHLFVFRKESGQAPAC